MKKVVDFLRKLENNNNRDWFEANKDEYKAALDEFNWFVEKLIVGISGFDDTVSGLTVRDCTYRIYRDTRFSKNKLPYKTHMGAYVCKGGKKSGNAGYYFHLEPTAENYIGGNLLSAGVYMPEPAVLHSIREDVCYNGEEFMDVVNRAKGFRLGSSDSLKRVPVGFPADSPYAELLKLKNFYLEKFVDDDFILSPDLLDRTVAELAVTADFVRHLNRAVDYARGQ